MSEELSCWKTLQANLQLLEDTRIAGDPLLGKINKIHAKVVGADKFTLKVGKKLLDVYQEAINNTEKEKRIIADSLENISILTALADANETGVDGKRKKRKIEEKQKLAPPLKKVKTEDEPFVPLAPGKQVVVRPLGQDFILAIVLKYLPEKQKYEVEDAEDDEEHPGTRKRYVFPTKLVIPIPDPNTSEEFPAGHTVLALYPNSSCFYKATVVKPPSKNDDGDAPPGSYCVRFEDDHGFERFIDSVNVLDMPKSGAVKKTVAPSL